MAGIGHDSTPVGEDQSESDSDAGSGEDEQVEWLATGREKRSTAGNRLTSLIQQEGEDDDLELLFAEDEEDEGFEESDAAASDVHMDSSDDDEDQGPAAAADDLEGEEELEKQARAERTKKRKVHDGIPKMFRKKVKVDPTALNASPLRPKKKSERTSWIPTANEAPTRASARRTTKKSKEQLYQQMLDREKRRLKQLANMEKASKKKEADKPKQLTQEDRLAEAARIEKKNSKSLNRWEEAEKVREEEQRAKLAALHDRKMEGPVITWWSGLAEWVGGRLTHVGKALTIEDKEKPRTKKRKLAEMESVSGLTAAGTPISMQNEDQTPTTEELEQAVDPTSNDTGVVEPAVAPDTLQRASIVQPDVTQDAGASPQRSNHNPPASPHTNRDLTSADPTDQPYPMLFSTFNDAFQLELATRVERSTRNCLILENFDDTALKQKDISTKILFGRTFEKAQKPAHPTTCVIQTSKEARYRDPSTGLPYHSPYAYREIQKLKRGAYDWCPLLQAYVGQSTYAARGVPKRFTRTPPAAGSGPSGTPAPPAV